MHQKHTNAIVLRRINYGEADRILTLLTRDFGKISVIAKGARKSASKMAGGIELLCESEIGYIKGKGDIDTLTSARMLRHFSGIAHDLDKMRVVADFLKRIDQSSEQDASTELYDLTTEFMMVANTPSFSVELIEAWGLARLLFILGETPNLQTDSEGEQFSENSMYIFSYEDSMFAACPRGTVGPTTIKFIRLLLTHTVAQVGSVKNINQLAAEAAQLLKTAYTYHRPTR